jgi:hypothetical protein
MDVQTQNGPDSVLGKPDSGDTVTYSFGRPVNPGTIRLGWDGTKPVSCAAPAPPGCVTLAVVANVKFDQNSNDNIQIFRDPQRTATDPLNQKLTSLGTVDLAADVYVGATGSFLRSPMELVNEGTAVQITIGNGSVATSPHADPGTLKWSASSEARDLFGSPFCVNCTVFESIVPWVDPLSQNTIDDEDSEF